MLMSYKTTRCHNREAQNPITATVQGDKVWATESGYVAVKAVRKSKRIDSSPPYCAEKAWPRTGWVGEWLIGVARSVRHEGAWGVPSSRECRNIQRLVQLLLRNRSDPLYRCLQSHFFFFLRLLALRPLLAYCASLG
jgi:hypothetical protein